MNRKTLTVILTVAAVSVLVGFAWGVHDAHQRRDRIAADLATAERNFALIGVALEKLARERCERSPADCPTK